MENYAIKFENVSKIYKLKKKNDGNTKSSETKRFYALKNISFEIPQGEVVGILGTNGSGKSTLSLILAGISEIDEGVMHINGEQSLVAINTGLNKQLTGLENINVKGALLGLSKKQIQEIIDGVIEFAELGDFLYQPVKKYSSGMKSRLGFSISLYLNPDIIIVDEALSVGDKGFAQKCINKMNELKDEGKTIIFISHSLPQVRNFCQTAMWIEGGMLKEYGEVGEVCDHYGEYVDYYNSLTNKEKAKIRDNKFKKRIVQNPQIGFWEKVLDRIKGQVKIMKKVITYGTFDLFHVGHLNIIKRAKALGDYLIVAVSSDAFNAQKGKKAYHSDHDRKLILEAIRYVDEVIFEESWDQKIKDVQEHDVDVFVMGDDWEGKFDFLKDYCEVVYLPRTDGISTTKIKDDLHK